MTGAAAHAAGGLVDPLVLELAIFALAALVGYWLARPTASAPLISATNAISSVIVIGALLSIGVDASLPGEDGPLWARLFGFIALFLASASIVGGFIFAGRSRAPDETRG